MLYGVGRFDLKGTDSNRWGVCWLLLDFFSVALASLRKGIRGNMMRRLSILFFLAWCGYVDAFSMCKMS